MRAPGRANAGCARASRCDADPGKGVRGAGPYSSTHSGAQSPASANPPPAAIAPVPQPASEEIIGPIQMRGETLEAVLFQLGRWTGRSIIRPQSLPAIEGYTLTLPPMPKSEIVLAVETMLELSGIA